MLNSDESVKAFSRGGNITIGGKSHVNHRGQRVSLMTIISAGGISAAAGPIGTGGQVAASLANPAPMFSYSRSKGKALRCIAANSRN